VSTHTPGPWEVFHHSIGTGVTSTKAFDVSDVAHCSGFDSRRTRDEELANARLIAAAPDLLEALKETTMHLVAAHILLKNGGKKAAASDAIVNLMLADSEKAFDLARAAIKKAEEVNS
jgi:hypothetical protein